MAELSIRAVSKRYGATVAVDDVSLEIRRGEFLTFLGDSGCGKTTLLRVVAGFAMPDRGAVWRDGVDITALAPKARRMGFVFQSYALFPTKTVAENIAFALRIAGEARERADARVRELARMIELDRLLGRYPHELSGGQQQRVALARALAPRPDVLLLDEPLSALDARIRGKLRLELRDLVDRIGVTAIYVTHDQEEALAISDRIAVMRAGRIVQVGPPDEIYLRPKSRFVAEFIGAANLLDGRIAAGGVEAHGQLWPAPVPPGARPGSAATIMVRPEHLRLAPPSGTGLRGVVAGATFMGAARRLRVALDHGPQVLVDCPSAGDVGALGPGAPIGIEVAPEHAVVLTEGTDA